MIADIGMHRIGKVDDGGPARLRHDLALGRKDINLVREEINLDVLEELGRVVALHFEQRLQPLVRANLQIGAALFIVLVKPMRGDAILGDVVHFFGADLHFNRCSVRADQRRVQGLIAVGLGDRDVILELPRHRLEQAVQGAQRDIAGRYVVDDDAEAINVKHLGEGQLFVLHLAIDRVKTLFAPENIGAQTGGAQLGSDPVENLRQQLITIATCRLHGARQGFGAHRMDQAE